MSFSRLIIEQRLADLELALNRQEELIVSQRDAIRSLRDLINIDQQAQQHPANAAMDMALSAHSNAYASAAIAPSAPMSLPRPSSFTSLNPNVSTTDGNISINNITNPSFLGQRSYASYYTENQNSSMQDITSMSFMSSTQGNSSSAVKRARIENTAAPVAPSLKRRRALEKLRQLSPVFPSLYSVASRGSSSNLATASTQQQNASAVLNTSVTSGRNAPVTQHPSSALMTLPPPTAPPSNTKKTSTTSAPALPAPPTTTTTASQKPSSTSTVQQVSLPNPSQKLVPTSLPMPKKGFNYGGVDTAAAITPAVTNNSQIPAKDKFGFPSSQHANQMINNNTNNTASNISAIKPATSTNVSGFGNNPFGSSTVNWTKPTDNPSLLTNNPGPVGTVTVSQPTVSIATNVQNATPVVQSTAAKASTDMIDLTSMNSTSTGANNNTNRVSPVFKPNIPSVTSNAITPITERVSRYKDELETMDKADSIHTKCEFLRALAGKLQAKGATVSDFLTEGGKDKCLQWLRKLEEENEELNIEGIVLLDMILTMYETQTRFSRDEVFTTRIDKLLRRIYKKYTAQKLSLGEPLLSKIRNLWADYRALFKEAAGDDANE